MTEKQGVVHNPRGIHLRPCGELLKAAQNFKSKIEVIAPDGRCGDVRSALAICALALASGSGFTVRAEGEDEEAACSRIHELLESVFDFH